MPTRYRPRTAPAFRRTLSAALLLGTTIAIAGCQDIEVNGISVGPPDEGLGAPMTEFQPYATKCNYGGPNEQYYMGACIVEHFENGHVISWPGGRKAWTDGATRSVWANGKLDGKPAMRFEHNRSSFSYVTFDIDESLDVGIE